MFTIVDSNTLIKTQSGKVLPGAVEAMREIAAVDQLYYISLMNRDTLEATLTRLGFPATQHIISCQQESDKLPTILDHTPLSEHITFISTARVLKALNIHRIWNNYPQAAATLASRFTFIIYGVEQIERELLPYAEFPVEALPSWQEITTALALAQP